MVNFRLLFKKCGNPSTSSGGGQSAKRSEQIKNEIVDNIKLPGIKRKAENGEGNYRWTKFEPVSESQAQKIERIDFIHDKGGYTVVDGVLNGEYVYFAAPKSNPTISKLREQKAKQDERRKQREEHDKQTGLKSIYEGQGTTVTTTYESWRKRNSANFEAWYYGAEGKKKKK